MDRFEENGMKVNHIEEHLEKDRKTKRKFENYPCFFFHSPIKLNKLARFCAQK